MATFEDVTKKIGKVKPDTKKIFQEVYEAAKKAGHEIWYIWGMGTSSEHATGRAGDLMIRNEAGGDWVRNYLWANRKRLRLQHVIWEQHITSTVTNPGVRRKMEDRGNATANHFDHIHFLVFQGRYQPPSPSVPTTPVAQPSGQRLLKYVKGQPLMQGHDVRAVQTGLWRHFSLYAGSLARDGYYGPATAVAVREFQRRSGLGADGIVGPKTWKELAKYGIKAP
jgi:hypothetical protein